MRYRKAAATCAVAILLTACASSIDVKHVSSDVDPQTGVPWNLAMTQYKITLSRQVTGCSNNKLQGAVIVTAVPTKVIDEDQRYVLSSSGRWATADISSSRGSDGTSLGLNAHSESQAAAIISSTVGILSGIAGAVTVLGEAPGQFKCKDDVSKAIAEVKDVSENSLSHQIEVETRAVADATDEVAREQARFQAAPGHRGNKEYLEKAVDALKAAKRALSKDQAKLSADLQLITVTDTVVWPVTSHQRSTGGHPFELSAEEARQWVEWKPAKAEKDGGGGMGLPVPWEHLDTSAFRVSFGLYRLNTSAGWSRAPDSAGSTDATGGVPVRLPRVGRLVACVDAECPAALPAQWPPMGDENFKTQPKGTVVAEGPILQLGQLYALPVAGGTFKSEGSVIAMDSNGIPTSVEIYEKTAAVAEAASAAQGAVNGLAAIPAQIASATLARTQAQLAQVNANSALAAAQASAPSAGSTAAALAQSANLNAQANLQTALANATVSGQQAQAAAQAALASQQADLAAQQTKLATARADAEVATTIASLNAKTNLAVATTAQINAQVALTAAEATLKGP